MDRREYRADFVRRLREELEFDQRQFARVVGVTVTAVSRWENARSTPRNCTWENLHDLRDLLRECRDPVRLKRKLLMAGSLMDEPAPVELLLCGQLDRELGLYLEEHKLLDDLLCAVE